MFIGHLHSLPVTRTSAEQIWLDAGDAGEVALPAREAANAGIGDVIDVFIHTDNLGQAVATTDKPLVQLGGCASLKVVEKGDNGTFLDWGLYKHLLLPYAEQRRPLDVGRYETVMVYLDNSNRLAASSRLDHHLPEEPEGFHTWQKVSLLIYQRTDLGLKAVIDQRAIGLLYKDEIFQSVRIGETHTGYVKRIRDDGRIDLSMQLPSRSQHDALTERIVEWLEKNNGVGNLTDKSPPEAIYATLQVSKKNFKKALGSLYRERRVRLETDCVVLIESATGDPAADEQPIEL